MRIDFGKGVKKVIFDDGMGEKAFIYRDGTLVLTSDFGDTAVEADIEKANEVVNELVDIYESVARKRDDVMLCMDDMGEVVKIKIKKI